MYCDRRQLEAKEGHDTSKCIVTEAKGMRQGIVSQYNAQQAHDTAACTLRYGHGGLRHGAQGRGARRAGARGTAPAVRRLRHSAQGRAGEHCDTAAWSYDTAWALGHYTAKPGHDTTRPART